MKASEIDGRLKSKDKTWHYEFISGEFVFFNGDGYEQFRCSSVSFAFDRDNGCLFKHGPKDSVYEWVKKTRETFLENEYYEMADSLSIMDDFTDLDEINRIVQISGYIRKWVLN